MEETAVASPPALVQQIPIDHIRSSSHQARKNFDEDSLKSLAESMKQERLLQPITVRLVSPSPLMGEGGDGGGQAVPPPQSSPTRGEDVRYELVSGERRWRAAKLLGWTAIDARIIQPVSEAEAAAKGLVENLQREDLNPIEEAEGIQALLDLHDNHWTQEQIGKVLGKSQSDVSRTIRYSGFSDQIKENMRRRIITEGHAVELLRLPSKELQQKVAIQIEKQDLSRNKTRAIVDGLLAKDPKSKKKTLKPSDPLRATWGMLKDSRAQINSDAEWSVHYAEQDKKATWQIRVSLPRSGAERQLPSWLIHLGQSVDQWIKGYDKEKKEADAFALPQKQVIDQIIKPLRIPKSKEEWAELEGLAPQGPGAVAEWICGKGNPRVDIWTKTTWKAEGYDDPLKGCHELVAEFKKHPLGV